MRKITLLLLFAIMAFAFNGQGQIFITELADPNNAAGARYVELYNAGATAVDLSTGYDLQRWTNDNASPQSAVELTGSIPAGGFYTVCANQTTFTSTFGFAADQNMGGGGPADGNGDDQLALRDPTDAIIDFFGVVGEDGSGTNHEFEDGRAERKATVTTGNATYTFAEWNIWNDTGAAGTTNLPQNAPADFDPGAWIGASAAPILTVSPLTLSGLNYELGSGPSAEQTFTVEGSNLTADIDVTPSTNYEISLDNSTYQLTAITLTQTGGAVATTTIYTRLQAGLAAGDYIEDIVISSAGASDKILTCTGAVETPVMTTLPYAEPFDLDLGDCYVYSVSGALETWEYGLFGGNGYAEINAYGSGVIEEDWLILPGIDFDSYSNERMTFDTWYQYGDDDVDNYLKLYWSSDYYGIGDPSSATWNEISFTQPAASNSWETSGTLDISSITGTNVYIALKHNYQPGSYRWWQVDNLSIYEEAAFVDVTLQVNMEDETVSPNGVHVAGSFNGWDAAATTMLDPEMDGTYEVTVSVIPGLEFQYKYINGNAWGDPGVAQEIVPAECGTDDGSGGYNRYFTPSETATLDVVCFGSCNDCGYVPPTYDVTFQVDMQNETVAGVVNIAGNFTSWGDVAMTNVFGSIWEITYTFDEGSFLDYKFKNGGDWEPGANREFWVPSENTVLDLVCYGSNEHCPAVDFVMINEVDADTPGTDAAEFIELYDGGVGYTPLHGLVVVLYNGSDDASYNPAIDLDGYFTDANGYFVIGSTGMGTPIEVSPGGSGWLQNGPDAVALHIGNEADYDNDTPVSDVNLIDALVYDTNDGDDSGLIDVLTPGQPQINEDGRDDKDNHSNQRIPNGSGGLRITSTYDQSSITMGAENMGLYTDWTGTSGVFWGLEENWTNGVPSSTMNALIPGTAIQFPFLDVSAVCNDLTIEAGASIGVSEISNLTVNGVLTNYGTLTIYSWSDGIGSLLNSTPGVNAIVQRGFNGVDLLDWHLVSSPIVSATASVFEDFYLQGYVEANNTDPMNGYFEVTDLGYGLNPFEGYAFYPGDGTPELVTFSGELNVGEHSTTLSAVNTWGMNLLGNPYPSSIDWEAVTIPGTMSTTVYYIDALTGNNLYYQQGGAGDGPRYIPPMQGFFVSTVAAETFTINDNVRSHSGAWGFLKSKNENMVVLEASGSNFSDKTWINFDENASVAYDNKYDAHKVLSYSNPELPQIFSINANEEKMAINGLPDADIIPVGFTAVESGEFTINAIETGSFVNIYLEDLFTSEFTDLLTEDYTFDFSSGDDPNRFILHFTPLSVEDDMISEANIYSYDKDVYVTVPEFENGNISVFNTMGQEVATAQINNTLNKISLNKSGYYIVKVMSENNVVTKKVFIK